MKRILLFSCLFLYYHKADSQNVTVKWGQLSSEKTYLRKLVAFNNEIIKLSLKKEGKGKNAEWKPVIKKYDANNLNEVVSVEIPNTGSKKYETLVKLKTKLYAIVSEEGSDKDEIKYSAQQIDIATLRPVGNLIPVATFLYPEEDIL